MSDRTDSLEWVKYGGKRFGKHLSYQATGNEGVYDIERGKYCKHRFFVRLERKFIADFGTLREAKQYCDLFDNGHIFKDFYTCGK